MNSPTNKPARRTPRNPIPNFALSKGNRNNRPYFTRLRRMRRIPHSKQTNSKVVMVTTLSCVLNILLQDTDLVSSSRSSDLNRVAVQAESPDPCENLALRDATEDSRLGSRRGQCSCGACAPDGVVPPTQPRRKFPMAEFTSAPVDCPCRSRGCQFLVVCSSARRR